ncbi:hypothetical protein JTE90_011770 [Oedothorax gibbosus]|uniref:Uncharacterized protein n=1 Tax=Oedothorax gibbosus TaxID=931172 RepID=A0AAV6VR29_9ARAC|nr:hypothetical protein JTE90_011770 [Oedothorax gibbosus]
MLLDRCVFVADESDHPPEGGRTNIAPKHLRSPPSQHLPWMVVAASADRAPSSSIQRKQPSTLTLLAESRSQSDSYIFQCLRISVLVY